MKLSSNLFLFHMVVIITTFSFLAVNVVAIPINKRQDQDQGQDDVVYLTGKHREAVSMGTPFLNQCTRFPEEVQEVENHTQRSVKLFSDTECKTLITTVGKGTIKEFTQGVDVLPLSFMSVAD